MFPIFNLTLHHSFFAHNRWLNTSLIPDNDTAQLLKRYQLQMIRQDNTWGLCGYAITGRDAFLNNLLNQLQDQPLFFWLSQPLENFVVFTDLPLNWQGLMAFDTDAADVSETEQSNANPGAVQLSWQQQAFTPSPQGTVACFRFYLDDLLANDQYQIQLNSRKTRWEFNLIQRSQTRLHDPEIISASASNYGTSNSDPGIFSKPEKYMTKDGETAWFSDSGTNLLPLLQEPDVILKLVDHQVTDVHQGKTVTRNIINALPTPRMDQLQKPADGSTEASSKMYVYV